MSQKVLAQKIRSLGSGMRMQENIKHKRECFKALQLGNNIKNWEKCQLVRRETKKVVSEAKSKVFERFYKALETKNGEQQIYKIAKKRKERTRDLDKVKCIKDEVDANIKER